MALALPRRWRPDVWRAAARAFAAASSKASVLVMNAGSSSFKFAVLPDGAQGFRGQVEGLGTPECRLLLKGQEPEAVPNASLKDSVRYVLERLPAGGHDLVGVGHRVVHGGMNLYRPTRITKEVLGQIHQVVPLAPLHNPPAIAAIEAAQQALPGLREQHVACFDTGFHHDLFPEAQMYAIPQDLARVLNIRKYGFHGISCQSAYRRGCEALKVDPKSEYTRVIIMHLGAGCSATAVIGGRSVDTSMGMTPLEGLMMSTRCGSIDPGIEKYMCDALNLSVGEVETILNKKSGLLGVTGVSGDMRTVLEYETAGTPEQQERCKLATRLWVYRLSKVIASMFVPLQNVNGLIFTGGIGENSAEIRRRVLESFQYRGVLLDDRLNAAHGVKDGILVDNEQNAANGVKSGGLITKPTSTIKAVVIHADEEGEIAKCTREVLGQAA